MFSSFTKSLEWEIRSLRARLSPSYRKSYEDAKGKVKAYELSNKPVAFFDLNDIRLDRDNGRYAYLLIKDFIENGYEPVLSHRYNFFSSVRKKRLKALIYNEDISLVGAGAIPTKVDVVVTDSDLTASKVEISHPKANIIKVDCSYRKAVGGELSLPYYAHPSILAKRLSPISESDVDNSDRLVKISFIGAYQTPEYDRKELKENFRIMSRHEAIVTLRKSFNDQLHFTPPLLSFDNHSSYDFVINEVGESIPLNDYLDLLQNTQFFVACPGVKFPLAHNLAESMLSGCIPILQHANHLNPPLVHGVNCLNYDSADSLVEILKIALSMSYEKRRRMQKEALLYAQDHFQSGCFSRFFFSKQSEHRKLIVFSNCH